eukprot:gb/GEZN01011931.1/.p1 GENE.gb/GEZN01011931.1/~~gb/GEZN01011931.1/.p1  ORF type:complete len:207 (-),score=19.82 gb/GEZN01011931.1/:499-1083(-)
MTEPTAKKDEEYDIYRDGPVRYLGYANELGEAFRPLVPRSLVLSTYGVASLYVLADTRHKTLKAHEEHDHLPDAERFFVVVSSGLDTLLWQSLASVAIPGFTIYQVVKKASSLQSTKYVRALPKSVHTMLPTVIGLGVIPFIVHPIDTATHMLMDCSSRVFSRQAFSYLYNRPFPGAQSAARSQPASAEDRTQK